MVVILVVPVIVAEFAPKETEPVGTGVIQDPPPLNHTDLAAPPSNGSYWYTAVMVFPPKEVITSQYFGTKPGPREVVVTALALMVPPVAPAVIVNVAGE